jgi:hypothetical protein
MRKMNSRDPDIGRIVEYDLLDNGPFATGQAGANLGNPEVLPFERGVYPVITAPMAA